MTLNCLRSYRQKYGREYGELVIICDGRNYWRKDIFPYYKAERKKSREESTLDWNLIFDATNKIKNEIKENFPYKFIRVDKTEADDVISVLCQLYGRFEKILIMSSDKDFVQLHTHPNIKQYDPVRKKWVKEKNVERYRIDHIVRGDRDDGVPNIRSSGDTFVSKGRQNRISLKFLEQFYTSSAKQLYETGNITSEEFTNFKRNEELIDLTKIPEQIKLNIIEAFDSSENKKDRKNLFNYFIKHRLKNLMTNIQEF